MIRRLKRQTKQRHSVRAERFVTFRNVKVSRMTTRTPWMGAGPTTVEFEYDTDLISFTPNPRLYDEPIIGARFSPDVWTP